MKVFIDGNELPKEKYVDVPIKNLGTGLIM